MAPRLRVNGEDIRYDGYRIGQYATNEATGEIVVAMWKPLFRLETSYALTCDVEEAIDDDVSTFFVVDTETEEVYRFPREAYHEAPIKHMNGQSQFVPHRTENSGVWPAKDVIIGHEET